MLAYTKYINNISSEHNSGEDHLEDGGGGLALAGNHAGTCPPRPPVALLIVNSGNLGARELVFPLCLALSTQN